MGDERRRYCAQWIKGLWKRFRDRFKGSSIPGVSWNHEKTVMDYVSWKNISTHNFSNMKLE
jgi:hypothetical protein